MNSSLKTFVVEDDQGELDVLEKRLDSNFRPLEVATTFDSAVYILERKASPPFNLSILDVQIGNNDCYQLIDKFGRKKLGILAFTTKDETGLRQRYIPNDHPNFFLTKPHGSKNVEELLNKILGYFLELKANNGLPFECNFRKIDNEHLCLNNKQILYFKGGNRVGGKKDYCWIYYVKDNTYKSELIKHSLKSVNDYLPSNYFWQGHRSYIFNVDHLDTLMKRNELPASHTLEVNIRNFLRKLFHNATPKRKS